MPRRAVKALFDATRGRDPIITTEVGQHQMWAAQHFGFAAPNRWLTSGGLGTMGYGFPAAVRAQCAKEGMASTCGFQDVQGCQCVQGHCENLASGAPVAM